MSHSFSSDAREFVGLIMLLLRIVVSVPKHSTPIFLDANRVAVCFDVCVSLFITLIFSGILNTLVGNHFPFQPWLGCLQLLGLLSGSGRHTDYAVGLLHLKSPPFSERMVLTQDITTRQDTENVC